jgi:nicotinamidase-related amidase
MRKPVRVAGEAPWPQRPTRKGKLIVANGKPAGVWDARECALLIMDYQDNTLGMVFEQDRRVIELNIRTLASAALSLGIPVVLSEVGVGMGLNGPTIPSLQDTLPGHTPIDRTTTNAWEDAAFLAAVQATGRTRLVMAGILTSVCLAYPVVSALADGYEVTFIEDAVGDMYKDMHDTAVLRLAHAGAVPNTAKAMLTEWFRDLVSPAAGSVGDIYRAYFGELAPLKITPQFQDPTRLLTEK